jgi:CHAT domain-containing protein
VCERGHARSFDHSTLFYDPRSARVFFAPTEAQSAENELNASLGHLLQNAKPAGRIEIEIIERDDIPAALERLERAVKTGAQIERASNRIFVVERAPASAIERYQRAFEHPLPDTALRIAADCEHFLSIEGLSERERVDLNAQRALCFLVATDPPPGALDEALQVFRRLLPAFWDRGSQTDWAATNRNIGEILLRRSARNDKEAALEALDAFAAAAPYLTEEYSTVDWARLIVGRAEALVRIGDAAAIRSAREELRPLRFRDLGPDPFGTRTRAQELLAELDGGLDAEISESFEGDLAAEIDTLLATHDYDALLRLARQGLDGAENALNRALMLYLKGLAILRIEEIAESDLQDAIVSLEEAIETDVDQIPRAEAAEMLCDAYASAPAPMLGNLPTRPHSARRIADAIIQAAARLLERDLNAPGKALRRVSKLLEGDRSSRAARAAVREILRSMSESMGDPVGAAIPPDEIAERGARFAHDAEELREYLALIDLFVDRFADAGEPELAANLLLASLDLRRAAGARNGEMSEVIEQIAKAVALMLQHGAYGDAFRLSVDLSNSATAERRHPAHEGQFGMAFALRGLGFHRDALRPLKELLADETFDDPTMRFVAQEAMGELYLALGNFPLAREFLGHCNQWEARNPLLQSELEARELGTTDPEGAAVRFRAIAYAEIRRHDDVRIILRAVEELVNEAIVSSNHEEAAHLLNFSFRLVGRLSRKDHPWWSQFMELAARLEICRDRPHKAFELMKDAVRSDWSTAHDLLSLGSAGGRAQRLAAMRLRAEGLLDLARRHYCEDPDAIALAYQGVVRTKALNSAIERLNREQIALKASGEAAIGAAMRRLAQLRVELGRLAFSNETADQLAALTQEKGWIETQLSAAVPTSAVETLMTICTLSAIEKHVPEDALLIDFIRHRPLLGGTPRYLAFLVRRSGSTRMVEVGDAAAIDDAVLECRTAASSREPGALRRLLRGNPALEAGRQLAKLVLEPLDLIGEPIRHLIISADGGLLSLPFELLPFDGAFLIDRFVVSYVSSARTIVPAANATGRESSPALVIGNPDYKTGRSAGETRDLEFEFERLPGTETEARQVAEMLGVRPLTGSAATKERLFNAASPKVVHLATHGYFLPAALAPSALIDHPLLRCGLAFANANGTSGGARSEGVLTAEEVLGLDLVSTDLAILSACETALGDLEDGEALAGLARSFEAAGAKSAIVSLWKVPDVATQKLMTSFYRRLTGGASRAEALRLAKLEVRDDHRWFRDWAGFVLQGDPRRIKISGHNDGGLL